MVCRVTPLGPPNLYPSHITSSPTPPTPRPAYLANDAEPFRAGTPPPPREVGALCPFGGHRGLSPAHLAGLQHLQCYRPAAGPLTPTATFAPAPTAKSHCPLPTAHTHCPHLHLRPLPIPLPTPAPTPTANPTAHCPLLAQGRLRSARPTLSIYPPTPPNTVTRRIIFRLLSTPRGMPLCA
jgi:hypothetical protein